MLSTIIFSILLTIFPPNISDYSCSDEINLHPVRNEIMLQIVLKSYNYYDGNIDGDIGPVSKTALINFQNNNDLDDDGILGPQTCLHLLNKNNIITNPIKVINEVTTTGDVSKYSEEVENSQKILKS